MDRPDWDGIVRIIHHRVGLLRFENSLGPIKRKRLEEIFDEEVPTVKKMKFSYDPAIPENNTLPEGWDEGLLERLQPANKSTNQEPAKTTNDLLISLPQQHQFTTTGDSIEFPIHQKQRAKSEEPTLEACARQARRRYLDEAVHLPVEHDDSEMSRKSPRSKKRPHSSSQDYTIDVPSDTERPLPKEEDGEESAEPFETDSIVFSSKRIKPNSGEKLQEHSGTPEPQSPTKTVSTGNAGTLRSGRQIHEDKEENASVEGNERDQKESNESQAAPKKWSYFDNQKKLRPSNIRDYGNRRPVAPVSGPSSSRGQGSMAPGPRPFKPHNGLRQDASNQGSRYSPQNLAGNRAPKSDPPFKPQVPRFDLHEDQRRRDEQHLSKRQRIEGTPISRNGSSGSPIDLEASPTTNGKATGTQTSRSAQGQAQKRSEYEVEEYGSLEKMMKPVPQKALKRKSSSSDSQPPGGRGSQQVLKNGPFKGTIVRHSEVHDAEDKDDPISDLEILDSDPAHKTTPQVVIEGRPYTGSAFRQPPRQNLNRDRSRNQSIAKARTQEVSPHFPPPAQTRQQGQNPSVSHSADGTAPSIASTRLSGPQNGKSGIKNASSRHSSPRPDPDESVDELNRDDPHQKPADALLVKQKTAKVADTKSKGADNRSQSIALDDSSDDALANNMANIPPTNFISSKKAKGKKPASKDEQYNAQLAFSETDAWLVDSNRGPWSLVHKPIDKSLELFDQDSSPVWALPTGKMEKIEFNHESQILVIHKARDLTTGSGTHIYLLLHDNDQSNDLRESLKMTQPTIQPIKKPASYLDNVVDNNLVKVLTYQETRHAAKKKRRSEEEPEDIKLAKLNSQRRLESKWPSLRETTTSTARVDVKVRENERTESEPAKSRGLARSMRTRSSSDHFDDEGLQQPSQIPEEVSSSEFYGNSTSRRAGLGFSHETRSSTRVQDRDRAPRQLRQRNPSPPPLKHWTQDNPDWTRDWHSSIIYPAVGKDRARVDMGDIEKLDDGEFLNDNLIVFYLRWLQDRLERQHPELAKRIYFQNTFFYQKLSNPEKGMKSINYEAVKKWTSKVDLLSKDYIIIPINEHSHWYVAIICNAPKLLPGAEATDHSQSQDTDGIPGDEHTNIENLPKASSALVAPSRQISESSNARDLDIVMKDVSLEDKQLEGAEKLPSVSNGMLEGQEVVESDNPPPANVTSGIIEVGTAKESQTKKSKRKSLPPQRKYNPKEFRIITLDSLGSPHTTTCSNLKDYLVLEIKDKKNIEIPRPGSVGTTAKGIPMQNNYYDCGLFLLSYVEMFLKSPDEFVSGILQSEPDRVYQMPKAPEMRAQIRDLLFNLQKEQLAEAERLAKLKGKGKKSSKTEDKSSSALNSKSSSREVSKSARVSPDGQALDERGHAQEKIVRPKAEPSTKEEPPKSRTSASAEPSMSSPGNSDSPSRPASPLTTDVPKPDGFKQREVHDLSAASQEGAKASGNMFSGIFSGATRYVTGFLNHEKPAATNASNCKPSKSDVIKIGESPQKVESTKNRPRPSDSGMEDSSRTLVANGHSNVERVEQAGVSKTRRQRDAQSSRQSLARHDDRDLTSPTPDAMEPSRRIPAEHEVHDLRTPSPEVMGPVHNGSTKAQHRASSILEKANRSVSENRERAVKAPSPEVRETPSPRASDRRPSRYRVNGERNSRQVIDDGFQGFEAAEVGESEGEYSDDDPIDFVKTNSRANGVSKASSEALASDEEMLLQPGNSQEEEVAEDADSSLISAPTFSSSPSVTISKKPHGGGKSAPSSPVLRSEGPRRSASTSPNQGTKRKSPGSGEADNWQTIRRPSPIERDALDRAMIGNRGQRGRRSGQHIRFDE